MAKKKTIKARAPRKELAEKKVPVRTDSASVEDETIRRVNKTLTSIEDFLARWDAAKTKPDDMFPGVVKMRQFRDALSLWQREAVKAKGRKDEESRIKRLKDFVLICRMYS
ncbi:hypothetical protein L0Y65_06075 [Candidatus Micrarchaeota archaeon]|nr:hypothetical protein [Candidatus Micrarchaeota archaeon]